MEGSQEPKTPQTAEDPIERAKYIRDALATEIAHRRQRRQQIFSWASSLLVAITGGTIALTFKEHRSLSPLQKTVLTLAIGVLGLHAIIWIDHHWEAEKKAKAEIMAHNGLLGIPAVETLPRKDWTTMVAVVLLAVAALLAVLIPIQ